MYVKHWEVPVYIYQSDTNFLILADRSLQYMPALTNGNLALWLQQKLPIQTHFGLYHTLNLLM